MKPNQRLISLSVVRPNNLKRPLRRNALVASTIPTHSSRSPAVTPWRIVCETRDQHPNNALQVHSNSPDRKSNQTTIHHKMNRKFRRKRLALSIGAVDQLFTPNYANLSQCKSLKPRYSITGRPQFLFYRWLLILLVLGPLIGLFRYANSQTASDLLVARNSPSHLPPDSSVNTFFHNGHLLENAGHFAGEFPDLATQADQLVTTVQHLGNSARNQKNTNQKPAAGSGNHSGNQRNQPTSAKQAAGQPASTAESSTTNNKNRSTRTSNQRSDNRRVKLQNDPKKKSNSTDSSSSSAPAAQSTSPSTSSSTSHQTPSHSTPSQSTSHSTSRSPASSTVQPASSQSTASATSKQSNEKRKQSETKREHVNSSTKLNESKADSRPAAVSSVAGSASREKSDLNLEEIAEESLKIESIGSSSVEYITDDEEKRTAAAGRQPSPDPAADESNTSNDLLHTGYRLANLEGESSLEIKDVYTDSQGEYIFNHQPLPHKMQYESEIQRLDGE